MNEEQVRLDHYLANLSRHSVVVVVERTEQDVEVAQAIREAGRPVVLLSDRYGAATDLTVAKDWEDLSRRWQKIGKPEARFIGLEEASEATCAEMVQKSQLNYWITHKRSRVWTEYTIANLRHLLKPSLIGMSMQLPHVPAFIVGSGPSLTKNREHMRAASEIGVVFGVNAGGAALDVAPHVTVSIESEDTRLMLGDTRDSIRAFALCCHPEVLSHGTGPLSPIYITNPSGAVDALTGKQRLECSISATTAAINLARSMGCTPIVLVGQDLGFTEGRLYAPETGGGTIADDGTCAWGERQANIPRTHCSLPTEQAVIELPGWGGGIVRSNGDYRLVTRYLADAAKHWPSANYELWDCTEGGARKPGWLELPLSEAVRVLRERALPSPTPEELREMLAAQKPLATLEDLQAFIGAQKDLTRAAMARAETLMSVCEQLDGEPAGKLPGSVDSLVDWVVRVSEWTESATGNAVFTALEEYRASRYQGDEAEERRAERAALKAACRDVLPVLADVVGRLEEAEGRR